MGRTVGAVYRAAIRIHYGEARRAVLNGVPLEALFRHVLRFEAAEVQETEVAGVDLDLRRPHVHPGPW